MGFFSNGDFSFRICSDFFRTALFLEKLLLHILQSNFFDTTVIFSKKLFLQSCYFFCQASFFRTLTSLQQSFFQNSYLFTTKLQLNSHFLKIGSSLGVLLFGTPTFFVEKLFRIKTFSEQTRYFCAVSSFSEELLFRKLTFRKNNIRQFAEKLFFHSSYFFTIYFFRRDTISQVRLKSLRVLSFVSIIAQSCLIVLWSHYIFSKVLFNSLYFLRVPTFSKQLYPFACATFSEDAVFQNSYFSRANLVFTVTLSLYHLVFSPVNTGVLLCLGLEEETSKYRCACRPPCKK